MILEVSWNSQIDSTGVSLHASVSAFKIFSQWARWLRCLGRWFLWKFRTSVRISLPMFDAFYANIPQPRPPLGEPWLCDPQGRKKEFCHSFSRQAAANRDRYIRKDSAVFLLVCLRGSREVEAQQLKNSWSVSLFNLKILSHPRETRPCSQVLFELTMFLSVSTFRRPRERAMCRELPTLYIKYGIFSIFRVNTMALLISRPGFVSF